MKRVLLLFISIVFFTNLFANDEKENQIKVAYTYNFLKNISWKDEKNLKTYRVLLVSNSDNLKSMFQSLALKKDLKEKSIEIVDYKNIKESNIQAIFIDNQNLELYEKVYYEYEKSNTLIISDNYTDKKHVMINLIKDKNKISFEINKANILNRDLDISPDIILLGGTEIDVAKLYRTSQDELKEQKETISSLNKNIENKNRELSEKLEAIEKQKTQIELQKSELNSIYASIQEQKEKLSKAEIETLEKEKSMNTLINLQKEQEKTYNEAKKNLHLLLKTIDEQKSNIVSKETAIKNQRYIIVLFSILLVTILVLGFNFIKQNRKLKANNLIIDSMLSQTKELHKKLQDSIDYAGMIQSALISSPDILKKYFKDSYAVWQAKDTVGGDIYIFEEINENECLIFAIDCTGHSVPGALVTVLVKAIEKHIMSNILVNNTQEISPAKILSIFNKEIKELLKQNDKESLSNAGFDGTILYYNRNKQEIKLASANSIVMLLRDGNILEYKGDRHSVGYKTSDIRFEYKEQTIELKKDDIFFISTDGLYDQNGGEKDLPMGRRKIKNILQENKDESLSDIKEMILYQLGVYQGKNERNDDISFISFKI